MRIAILGTFARTVLAVACGLALAASASGLDTPEPRTPSSVGAAATASPRTAPGPGLVAVVDASQESQLTGDALLAEPDLAAAFSTSAEGLFEEVLPDGSVMVRLQGRFQNVLVATVTPEGRVTTSHRPLPGTAFVLEPHREPAACRPFHPVQEEEGVNHAQN